MAKSARAVSIKRKRNILREKVINPIYDARTERLSAKLLEIASKPKPKEEAFMDLDGDKSQDHEAVPQDSQNGQEESMDVDGQNGEPEKKPTSKNKPHLNRTQKAIAKRKAKRSIIFPKNAHQRKRIEAAKARKRAADGQVAIAGSVTWINGGFSNQGHSSRYDGKQ